jgi:tetratricopeptide (TPR) repeat protein
MRVDARALEALFHEAVSRPRPERAAFVRARTEGDPALRDELLELLREVPESGEDSPLFTLSGALGESDAGDAPDLGRHAGPYHLVECIGRGGMGIVYRGVRVDGQLEREVAVKLVRAALDGEALLRRFRRERQILARLEHPRIPRLLDAGATRDGRPYLVMDLVRGEPLLAHCDARRLDLGARLRLFTALSDTVAAAHALGVVHRDLKPGNVLVSAEGDIRLLDFGVAASLTAGLGPTTTQAGLGLGTPAYASPEQARGAPPRPTDDVYSLGVLLAELLCGLRPGAHGPSARQAFAALDPVEAARLADLRATQPGALRRRLAGDLGSILLQALHADPARRYASARELSDDLERHLGGRPVRARRPRLSYRLACFSRRRRRELVGLALGACVLAAVAVAGHWASQRARHSEQALARLLDSMVYEIDTRLADQAGTLEARARALEMAIEGLERLRTGRPFDPLVVDKLAAAYTRLGDIQGASRHVSLTRSPEALAAWNRAQALRHDLLHAAPPDRLDEQRSALAGLLVRVAAHKLDHGTDLRQPRRLLARAEQLATAADQETRATLTLALWLLAEIDYREGQWISAELRLARLVDLDPGLHGAALAMRGTLAQDGGDARRAAELQRAALGELEGTRRARPANATARRDVVRLRVATANTLAHPHMPNLGDRAGARTLLEDALVLATSLAADEPGNERARLDAAVVQCTLGWTLGTTDAVRADALLAEGLATLERFVRRDPPGTRLAAAAANCHLLAAARGRERRRPHDAARHYAAAADLLEALPDHGHDEVRLWRLREAWLGLATTHARLGEPERARAAAARAHALAGRIWRVDPRPWHAQRRAAAEHAVARLALPGPQAARPAGVVHAVGGARARP